MPDIFYLSLGSNLGNRERNLMAAVEQLRLLGKVLSISSIYETEPVEFTQQPEFLNCALEIETSLPPAELMKQLLNIEKSLGRQRIQKKGPRTIDLDILLYGDRAVNMPELTIPHPAMQFRRFVLEPLAEISPEVRHPLLKKTAAELLRELPIGQGVRRIAPIAGFHGTSGERPTTNDDSTEE
jgi:2-amino-4-hydroxy-6-hydroxymethyldihydropteridine diphosphokinase